MSLVDVQTRLSGWIRAPEGVARALDEQDGGAPGASTGIARRRLEALIRGDGALDATGRLEIYANAYFHRIHGVLCDDYPALAGALGADLFRDLVTSYLLVHPSRHPSLRYVGDRLPGFLATEDAAAGLRERAPWAADLAALEWLRCEVFDAADEPLLTRDAVAARAPEAFADLSLRLGSWVRLAHFAHPVDRIWRQGCDGKAPAATSEVEPVCMLVFRREERVLHRPLEDLEADALEARPLDDRFRRPLRMGREPRRRVRGAAAGGGLARALARRGAARGARRERLGHVRLARGRAGSVSRSGRIGPSFRLTTSRRARSLRPAARRPRADPAAGRGPLGSVRRPLHSPRRAIGRWFPC